MPSLAHPDAVFLGMDVHKDSISVGILNPGREVPEVEKIFHDRSTSVPHHATFARNEIARSSSSSACRLRHAR
jgi:hypothetical protein